MRGCRGVTPGRGKDQVGKVSTWEGWCSGVGKSKGVCGYVKYRRSSGMQEMAAKGMKCMAVCPQRC
jgi:hypothetical protein